MQDPVKKVTEAELCLDLVDAPACRREPGPGREWHNAEFRAGSSKKDTHTVSGPCPWTQASRQPTHAPSKGGDYISAATMDICHTRVVQNNLSLIHVFMKLWRSLTKSFRSPLGVLAGSWTTCPCPVCV